MNDSAHNYPPAFLCLSAYYGIPQYLQPHIDESILKALNDKQKTRAENGLYERMSVIPRTKGMYWVISYSNEEAKVYSINYTVSSCTCQDYLYNCAPEPGLVCKHVWKVRFLVNQNAIPSENDNPYNWLLTSLDKDIRFYLSQQKQQLYNKAIELRNEIGDENSRTIDYWDAYKKRAKIHSKLTETGDMSVFEQTPETVTKPKQFSPKEKDKN